jgi:excisionase family DNA binding protein
VTTPELLNGIASAGGGDVPALLAALAARLATLNAAPSAQVKDDVETEDGDVLLTLPQAAERLGVPEHFARELGRRGELPVVHLGDRYVRVRVADLRAFVHKRLDPR